MLEKIMKIMTDEEFFEWKGELLEKLMESRRDNLADLLSRTFGYMEATGDDDTVFTTSQIGEAYEIAVLEVYGK